MTPRQPEPPVLVHATSGLGRITLNRPRAINALNFEMIQLVTDALETWREDGDVSAVLIDSAGDRGLCAGGDVRALREALVARELAIAEQFFRREYAMNALIAEYPKPIVAFADGITMGGGIGLAGHASTRIVTERSVLAMPETRIGFTPDVGATWLLAHAPGHLGEYLGLTGATMTGADAIAVGFADRFVPSGRLGSLRDALAHRADSETPDELVLLFDQTPEKSRLVQARAWIDDAFSRDTVAEIIARLDELGDDAAVAADTLRELSPSSLVVTLASIRRARELSGVRETLEQEFHVGAFLAARADMPEGIRAQLVDKDRNPQWSPATVAEVPTELPRDALAFRAAAPLWA